MTPKCTHKIIPVTFQCESCGEFFTENVQEERHYLIYFEDQDVKPEIFTSQEAAIARFNQLDINWNCHLFERVS